MLSLKFLLFYSFIYSSITVGHSLPLSVHLSSLDKQTRSPCQLHPSPIQKLAEPITTCPGGIPKMQLFDPLFAEPSTMQCGYAGVVIETDEVQLFWLFPFNIIILVFLLCSVSLSVIHLNQLSPVCHSTFACLHHWSFCQRPWLI